MKVCQIVDLGMIGYAEAYALQKRIVAARKAEAVEDVLLLCEHPHVITQGRNGKREHLLVGEHVLRQKGVEFYETSRGGDITYHGPGQIVGYPILNLGEIRRDVVWYVRMLEEAMIRATAEFGISAKREAGKTGIWVDVAEDGSSLATRLPRAESRGHSFTPSGIREDPLVYPELRGATSENDASLVTRHSPHATSEKLGAIGVHISRWVTSHGFAYNVSTDLRFFDLIVPCGIADRKATSLEKLLGREVRKAEVAPRLAKHLGELFGLEMKETPKKELFGKLERAEQSVEVSA